jgi:putative tryptophan/tyrosine transport system substrate-binding protein
MRRRQFISLLGGAAVIAWPSLSNSQQVQQVRKIGILVPAAAGSPQWRAYINSFKDGLQSLGWADGHNVQIEERWGAGADEIATGAAELATMAPDVILAAAASAARPMHQVTRSVAIVFANVPDPVANGIVTSLARPGGNITGFANYEPKIAVKWLELLKQLAPGVTRVAFIHDPANPTVAAYMREMVAAASSVGVQVFGAAVRNTEEIERAIEAFAREPNGGLVVPSGPATTSHQALVIALAAHHRLPSVHPTREAVEAGALASYGVDTKELFRSAASYVDRILKGEKPSDLPVQFASKFELVINLKTAKFLGLDPPLQLLARTDEVIE